MHGQQNIKICKGRLPSNNSIHANRRCNCYS